jgi:hypothetical protein
LLEQIVPEGGAAEVDFWLVTDPLININRGRLVQHAQLALLVGNHIKLKNLAGKTANNKTASFNTSQQSNSNATAAWEDEGGLYSKCA